MEDVLRRNLIEAVKFFHPLEAFLKNATGIVARRYIDRDEKNPPLEHVMSLATSTLPDLPYGLLYENLNDKTAPSLKDVHSPTALRRHVQLMLLSALAYENRDVVGVVMKQAKLNTWRLLDAQQGLNDTQALLVKCDDDTLVLSFRGTEPTNLVDWLTDANFTEVPPWSGDDSLVHKGFHSSLQEFKQGLVIDELKSTNEPNRPNKQSINELFFDQHDKNKKVNLILTGHSLGAGLAMMAGAWFSWMAQSSRTSATPPNPPPVAEFLRRVNLKEVVGFAGPVIGDKSFTTQMEKRFKDQNVQCSHYVLGSDIVPRLHCYKDIILPFAKITYADYSDCTYLDRRGAVNQEKIPYVPFKSVLCGIVEKQAQLPLTLAKAFYDRIVQKNVIDTSSEWNTICDELFPPCIFDHFPSEYLNALREALKQNSTELSSKL